MCGIGGFYSIFSKFNENLENLNKAMLMMEHRGPDANSIWTSDDLKIGFCHTRLSIIDLNVSSNQPMRSHDNKYILVFNGEIYNYLDLKKKLISKGCKFRTNSDSEVVIEAYRIWKQNLFEHLEGMFTFAIYDKVNKQIFIANDHIGKKPLYYYESEEGFFFASELPALKKIISKTLNYNYEAIASIFIRNLRNIPPPYTPYKEIKKLRSGTYLIIKNRKITQEALYYKLKEPNINGDFFNFESLIKEQVSKRLISDAPLGILLSGGLDSTIISSLMAKNKDKQFYSYSIGRNEKDADIIYAKDIAKKNNFLHREIFYEEEEDFNIFKKLISQYDEPIALLPLIHLNKLSRKARQDNVKVLLSGNGADELFYGYDGYLKNYFFSKLLNYLSKYNSFLKKSLTSNINLFFFTAVMRKSNLYENEQSRYLSAFIDEENFNFFENIASREIENLSKIAKFPNYIDESNFTGLMIENSHSLTLSSDIAGMNSSVEIRSPYLDKDLINFAFSMKPSEKIKFNNFSYKSKYPLRKLAFDLKLNDINKRPKRGLGYEYNEKNLLQNKWKKIAENYFMDPIDLNGFFSKNKIKSSWIKFLKNDFNSDLIFKQFVVQLWLRNQI